MLCLSGLPGTSCFVGFQFPLVGDLGIVWNVDVRCGGDLMVRKCGVINEFYLELNYGWNLHRSYFKVIFVDLHKTYFNAIVTDMRLRCKD